MIGGCVRHADQDGGGCPNFRPVIASGAKQSRSHKRRVRFWIATALKRLAMTALCVRTFGREYDLAGIAMYGAINRLAGGVK